jgi:epoxyqueuosine reductase
MRYEEWDVWTRGSAIRRAGYAGLRRNVAVGLGNWLARVNEPPVEALAVLQDALDDAEPLVREHAAWALEQR